MKVKNKETASWNKLVSKDRVEKTINALKQNGINAVFAETKEEAKKMALALIPEGSEVMTMSSVTLDSLGISNEINESKKYDAVKHKLYSMDRKTQSREMQKLGAAPDYAIGSVNAVTEDGKLIIASNTGSQIPAYSYASSHVIWVVGIQKIVKNLDEGMKRLYEYTLPLESERLKKIYGVESFVSKILIVNRDISPNRINLIFVNDVVGF